MPRALACPCLGCLEGRQSLWPTLRVPGRCDVWSWIYDFMQHAECGRGCTRYVKTDMLRRSNPTRDLSESTSQPPRKTHSVCVGVRRQRVPAPRARHSPGSENLLSTPLLMTSPGRSPSYFPWTLAHWLFSTSSPGRLRRILQITYICLSHCSNGTNLCVRRKACT